MCTHTHLLDVPSIRECLLSIAKIIVMLFMDLRGEEREIFGEKREGERRERERPTFKL
jgi:hypothetical protein